MHTETICRLKYDAWIKKEKPKILAPERYKGRNILKQGREREEEEKKSTLSLNREDVKNDTIRCDTTASKVHQRPMALVAVVAKATTT